MIVSGIRFCLTESNEIRYFLCSEVSVTGIKKLRHLLESLANEDQYLFGKADFAPVFPELSPAALKMLISRSVSDGLLDPVCRGIYRYPRLSPPHGLLLCHTASKLRAGTFNYISLESALSDAGVISQMPIQWLTLMSGGRSGKISCGKWGTIEFVHTVKTPGQLAPDLVYDGRCRLWRASVSLAMRDMRSCRRSMDLVDREAVDESL